jgi:multidrug efflux pump subunit AcrB
VRRAVILATLAFLLLAVAGVTAAQEGVFESAGRGVDVSETIAPENTAPERTSPETAAAEETTPADEEPPAAEESGEPVGKPKGSDKAGKGGQPRARTERGTRPAGGRSPSATRARRLLRSARPPRTPTCDTARAAERAAPQTKKAGRETRATPGA